MNIAHTPQVAPRANLNPIKGRLMSFGFDGKAHNLAPEACYKVGLGGLF